MSDLKKVVIRPLLTGDLFTLSRIMKKLGLKDEIKKAIAPYLSKKDDGGMAKAQQELGATIAFMVIENLYQAEAEINTFVGTLTGKTVKEVEKLPMGEYIGLLVEAFSQPGVLDFLKLAAN